MVKTFGYVTLTDKVKVYGRVWNVRSVERLSDLVSLNLTDGRQNFCLTRLAAKKIEVI